MEKSV